MRLKYKRSQAKIECEPRASLMHSKSLHGMLQIHRALWVRIQDNSPVCFVYIYICISLSCSNVVERASGRRQNKKRKHTGSRPNLVFRRFSSSLVEVGQSFFCRTDRGEKEGSSPLAINHRKEKEKGAKDLLKLENLLYFLFFGVVSKITREVQGGVPHEQQL